MGSVHIKHFCYRPEHSACLEEKSVGVIICFSSWTSCSFLVTFLLVRTTDKLWLFRLGCLADIFSKMNNVRLSLQGK